MLISGLVIVFVVGLFVGAYRSHGDIVVCRDCLRKLPIESEAELP